MKGFFGILQLNTGNFTAALSKYHKTSVGHKTKDYFIRDTILLESFGSPFAAHSNFPDLQFIGWCRLDNSTELQSKLNLSPNSIEEEIILAAYQQWGDACVQHFIGDFSFAIWDNDKQTLLLAKDQLGIRPLFYIEQEGLLYFGTSIPILKSALLQQPILNERYIATELRHYPQEVEDTFFKDIKRLKPAHYITLSAGNTFKEIRYWELNKIDLSQCRKKEDYYTLLRSTLEIAIKSRIRAKKTIGCQLSGGMDSSAIAVLLSRLMDKKDLHTYSFVLDETTRPYSENGVDEQGTQNEIISYADLFLENHHPITSFHYKDAYEEINQKNNIMGGFANSDCGWQDSLYKKAANHNQLEVVFSGFPGDEGVSQYGDNFFYDYLNDFNFKGLFRFLLDFRRSAISKVIHYYKAKKAKTTVLQYPELQERRNLLSPTSQFYSTLKDSTFYFDPSFKSWQKKQICRSHTTLRTESEGAYANQYNIETVYPLADIRLLEIMYSLPADLFKPKPYNRALFRNMCIGILPDKVRLQSKNSGATTLAFAHYWIHTKAAQLKKYQIKNHTGLMLSEDDYLKEEAESEMMKMYRYNTLKELDYLIDLNLPSNYTTSLPK
jgi:asparagine synthase (glutamine-hydrolysing)